MTQHPNLDIIGKFFDAYGKHDLEGIRAVVDENVKWTIPGHHPLSGTKVGVDEVVAFFTHLGKSNFKADRWCQCKLLQLIVKNTGTAAAYLWITKAVINKAQLLLLAIYKLPFRYDTAF